MGKGKTRTVRENNRQGEKEGEDTRLVHHIQLVQDGGANTPEMGLARLAGALGAKNRAERPGTEWWKARKNDFFRSRRRNEIHFHEKDVFLKVSLYKEIELF